ncbi:hypothetical protein B6C83_06850 [Aerococcus urinae]|nr:hypothetical protein B6C83_06850 [Aerococcus urinae]RAV66096.1 hypothetical protein DBT42_05460 [Aerococcus urinae]
MFPVEKKWRQSALNWKVWKTWNKSAFTLIEAVLALALFFMIQSLFVLVVEVEINHYQAVKEIQQDDWGVFLMQLQREARHSRLNWATGTRLNYQLASGQRIQMEYYSNRESSMIRRLVSGRGHQPYLMGVEWVNFTMVNSHQVRVNCRLADQKEYQAVISFREEARESD